MPALFLKVHQILLEVEGRSGIYKVSHNYPSFSQAQILLAYFLCLQELDIDVLLLFEGMTAAAKGNDK